jgi:hypothetical protein
MLAMTTLVSLSHHLGLMWVAMEATTLVSAPSIYFNHNARSLEATWKYLLIGSVGIALALLGSFFLAYSSLKATSTCCQRQNCVSGLVRNSLRQATCFRVFENRGRIIVSIAGRKNTTSSFPSLPTALKLSFSLDTIEAQEPFGLHAARSTMRHSFLQAFPIVWRSQIGYLQ